MRPTDRAGFCLALPVLKAGRFTAVDVKASPNAFVLNYDNH